MNDFKFVHESNLRSKIAENYNNKRQEITDFLIKMVHDSNLMPMFCENLLFS